MKFDLFADEPIAAAPPPQLSPRAPDPERLAYALTPTGQPNRWKYRGEILLYDTSKLAVPGRGRWSSLESIGKPELRGDSHVDVCKAIDVRLGGKK